MLKVLWLAPLALLVFYHTTSHACMSKKSGRALTQQEFLLRLKKGNKRTLSAVSDQPFGGPKESNQKLEAVIANVIQRELKAGYAKPNIKRVIVSLPVQFNKSNYFPYGDGQSNAHVDFGDYWKERVPPVVARREIYKDGTSRLEIFFAKSLGFKDHSIEQSGSNTFIKVKDFPDAFVINTDPQVLGLDEFTDLIPQEQRLFSDSRKAPDPEGIFQKSLEKNISAFEVFGQHKMGAGYNALPYPIDNVHGRFPDASGRHTAIGGALSWVVDANPLGKNGALASFKHIYTCFDGRSEPREAATGVPSGSGWHHIGDPAESILNTLETTPLLVALGKEAESGPKTGTFAFQLKGTITATRLMPKEVFSTRKNQFHWYAIESSRPICTEIWVHPCEMSTTNGWGFGCGVKK
jgi:hypothetical protein